MYRDKIKQLEDWRVSTNRKPLVLKGARQVGKTWLVREFGKSYRAFIEINFEKTPQYSSLFRPDFNPRRILNAILDATGHEYYPGETLLFFDEAQEAPSSLKSLRYFYEELPDLHLICAGSLLDFALEEIPTGVGRITYLDLYPLTFGEYLLALGEDRLRTRIREQTLYKPLLDLHHQTLLRHLFKYLLIGGMPEVVKEYINSESLRKVQQVQTNLIRTFQDDFVKYAKKKQIKYLDLLFRAVPLQLGSKFIFAHVGKGLRVRELSPALDLLEKARIVHKVFHYKADGLPLQARLHLKRFKTLLLDIGLSQNILGVNLEEWIIGEARSHILGGAIAEAFVGQELVAHTNATTNNPLVYWHRETRGSGAEVDYLLDYQNEIVPVEVKAGPTGKLKSLHLFIQEKRTRYGLKISSQGFGISGNLISVPLYAVERLFVTD